MGIKENKLQSLAWECEYSNHSSWHIPLRGIFIYQPKYAGTVQLDNLASAIDIEIIWDKYNDVSDINLSQKQRTVAVAPAALVTEIVPNYFK